MRPAQDVVLQRPCVEIGPGRKNKQTKEIGRVKAKMSFVVDTLHCRHARLENAACGLVEMSFTVWHVS